MEQLSADTAWKKAFDCKMANDVTQKEVRVQIAEWLKCAREAEKGAVEIMEEL